MLAVLHEDRSPAPPEDVTADFSGQLRLRIPRSLHERLARLATAEGVSLNQEMVVLLAQGCGLCPSQNERKAVEQMLGPGRG